jgi:hypothetical protein
MAAKAESKTNSKAIKIKQIPSLNTWRQQKKLVNKKTNLFIQDKTHYFA